MEIVKYIILSLIGFGSGVVIAGAVFAFIAIIGVVPRFAQKTKTVKFIKLYEEAIIFGGIFGTSTIFIDYYIPIGNVLAFIFSLCIGMFFGAIAVSLAEILDVVPILSRRVHIQRGMRYFLLSIAVGKFLGSALYYFVPGFFNN